MADLRPGPDKFAQFLAQSSSSSAARNDDRGDADDDELARERAPSKASQPPRQGIVARLSKRLSVGRRSVRSSSSASVSLDDAPANANSDAKSIPPLPRGGLVRRLSERWSNERRADREAVHVSSSSSAASGGNSDAKSTSGFVRRMSHTFSGAPFPGDDNDDGDDDNHEDTVELKSDGGSSADARASRRGLVKRISRAWSRHSGSDPDAPLPQSPQQQQQQLTVKRGHVRRLSQQWEKGALVPVEDFVEEDEPEPEQQQQQQVEREPLPLDEQQHEEDDRQEGEAQQQPRPRKSRKSIGDLISLFGMTGAVSAQQAKPPPERPSLTRLQQRTLERKKKTKSAKQQKQRKLPPNVTPIEEFKLGLGPRRPRRATGTSDRSSLSHEDNVDVGDANSNNDDDVEDDGRDDAVETNDAGDKEDDDDAASRRSSGARRSRMLAKLDRIRSMNANPACPVCDKPVYRMERLSDSRDRAFHHTCLKCEDCPQSRNQVGQVVHVLDEPGKTSGLPRSLVCHTHLVLRQEGAAERVKGWAPTNEVNEGGKFDGDPQGARRAVSRTLERAMGRKPLCSRCGGEILLSDEKNLVVRGMERLHLQCPDPSEIKHTPRHFVLGAPDRLPVLFAGDARAKKGHSFLFRLESVEHKAEALEQHRLAPARLRYVPETEAHSAQVKTIRCDGQHFAVFDRRRRFQEGTHPVTGKQGFTKLDEDAGVVLAQLYRVEAGVVHGLSAAFGYSYNEEAGEATLEALSVELTFEVIDVDDFTGAEQELAKVRARSLKLSANGDGAKKTKQPERFSLRLKDDFCERVLEARR